VVTERRAAILSNDLARDLLRAAFRDGRQCWRFRVDAMVMIPDHLHTFWTLPTLHISIFRKRVTFLDFPLMSCTIVKMNVVADTNIFLAIALDEPEKQQIIELTVGSHIVAPTILIYEIGNALTALVKRHRLSPEEAKMAFQSTQNIPVKLTHSKIQQSLEIAFQFNLYAYDAYFLQCAQSFKCPFITLDRRAKEVAKALNIVVLE
jgi:predicted nucleic acid-binding protein